MNEMEKFKYIIGYYRKLRIFRVFVVIFVSLAWWYFFTNMGNLELFGSLIVFWILETYTINLLFERDFYPVDLIADRIFERGTKQNEFCYKIGYALIVLFMFYILSLLVKV